MFWKKGKPPEPEPLARFPHYVIEKIIPSIDATRHNIHDTACKLYRRRMGGKVLTHMLLHFGSDCAMLASLAFSNTLQNLTRQQTTDIEYGDCYLATLFCLTKPLRNAPETAIEALSNWAGRLRTDAGYLIFSDQSQIDDLCEVGWDKFESYRVHKEAILPRAYLYHLAQIIRHRHQGHDMPYKYFDPMISADPVVFSGIEYALTEQVAPVLNVWIETLLQIQSIAEDHEEEFWID